MSGHLEILTLNTVLQLFTYSGTHSPTYIEIPRSAVRLREKQKCLVMRKLLVPCCISSSCHGRGQMPGLQKAGLMLVHGVRGRFIMAGGMAVSSPENPRQQNHETAHSCLGRSGRKQVGGRGGSAVS